VLYQVKVLDLFLPAARSAMPPAVLEYLGRATVDVSLYADGVPTGEVSAVRDPAPDTAAAGPDAGTAPRKRGRPKAAATAAPAAEQVAPSFRAPEYEAPPVEVRPFLPPQPPTLPGQFVAPNPAGPRVFPANPTGLTSQSMAYDISLNTPVAAPSAPGGPQIPGFPAPAQPVAVAPFVPPNPQAVPPVPLATQLQQTILQLSHQHGADTITNLLGQCGIPNAASLTDQHFPHVQWIQTMLQSTAHAR